MSMNGSAPMTENGMEVEFFAYIMCGVNGIHYIKDTKNLELLKMLFRIRQGDKLKIKGLNEFTVCQIQVNRHVWEDSKRIWKEIAFICSREAV